VIGARCLDAGAPISRPGSHGDERLLIGILTAATLAGVLGARAGGFLSRLRHGSLSLTLARKLPRIAPGAGGYRSVLRSVATLILEEPLLRQRMGSGRRLCRFSVLWTTIAFLLSAPYGYGRP